MDLLKLLTTLDPASAGGTNSSVVRAMILQADGSWLSHRSGRHVGLNTKAPGERTHPPRATVDGRQVRFA